jgi:hypothetical protein
VAWILFLDVSLGTVRKEKNSLDVFEKFSYIDTFFSSDSSISARSLHYSHDSFYGKFRTKC